MNHIPSVQNYPVEEVMLDLLHTAAHLLTIGGYVICSVMYIHVNLFEFIITNYDKYLYILIYISLFLSSLLIDFHMNLCMKAIIVFNTYYL